LAFERRMRAFFFLVFFDMGVKPSGVAFRFHGAPCGDVTRV
jgi:hypothetical protein